jgi:hypothetical protein
MNASDFNEWYEVGVSVILTDDFGKEHQTNTKSEAWELGDGSPVIMVDGRSGGYDLNRIKVMESHK